VELVVVDPGNVVVVVDPGNVVVVVDPGNVVVVDGNSHIAGFSPTAAFRAASASVAVIEHTISSTQRSRQKS
jgi:hypothetical protein